MLLLAAAAAIRSQVKQVTGDELMESIADYPLGAIAGSIFLTAASFAVLALVELFALRQAGSKSTRSISRTRGATTGFIAHALSQSLGFAMLTGPTVRLRSYTLEDSSTVDVARVSAFVTITVTLGLLATGGASLLAGSSSLIVAGYRVYLRWIGVVLALFLGGYLAWCSLPGTRRIGPQRWQAMRPRLRVAFAQTLISALDWVLAASVLFVLLPEQFVTYRDFLPAFFVAQTLAMVSHVPGGLGVFETVLFALLGAGAMGVGGASAVAALAAALVLYRFVYYLLPLLVAAAIALVAELKQRILVDASPALPTETGA